MQKTPNVRPRPAPPTTVVLHATGPGTLQGAVAWLTNPKSGVSAHYVVGKGGEVLRLADPVREITWHAGASRGPGGKPANATSIGIELVNRNDGNERYPPAQTVALADLLRRLKGSIPSLKWLTTHRDVCLPPGRKTDPLGLEIEPLAKASGLTVWTRGMA
jgi:N-acetylmuramoyl-L-alanine amidase